MRLNLIAAILPEESQRRDRSLVKIVHLTGKPIRLSKVESRPAPSPGQSSASTWARTCPSVKDYSMDKLVVPVEEKTKASQA